MNIENLQVKAKGLPKLPGVYLMKSAQGEILYVGKASNLKSRVSSYFSKEAHSRYQVRFLLSKTKDLETIVTHNSKEALLLENTLIKKHRPRYNIELKDDKSYASIKLSIQHEAPRLYITRRIRRDGSLYFGPYTSAGACREVVEYLQRYFKIRNCTDTDYRNRSRPCLQYDIKRCDAPCVGLIALEDYQKLIGQVRLFLEGRSTELKKQLVKDMKLASQKEDFEEAARLRDLIRDMEKTLEKQKIVSFARLHQDVLGFCRQGDHVMLNLLRIQEGVLQESRPFYFRSYEDDQALVSSFLTQFYEGDKPIPQSLLLPFGLEDRDSIAEILSERAKRRIKLQIPQRGKKLSLQKLAGQNAKEALKQKIESEENIQSLLSKLQKRLYLQNFPERLECYDISNFQGAESIGSMVTFLNGKPAPRYYRQFKIKSVQGPNDFASLYEVLVRRFKRSLENKNSETDAWAQPQLVIIDGGKGQLNAAVQAFKDLGIQNVDLVALAKSKLKSYGHPRAGGDPADPSLDPRLRGDDLSVKKTRTDERVFLPGRKNPVILPQNSSELFILMHARDEAHRFGITAHRKKLKTRSLHSGLENIPGVGKVRAQKLLTKFGSLKGIKAAQPEAIAKLIRVSVLHADQIQQNLFRVQASACKTNKKTS